MGMLADWFSALAENNLSGFTRLSLQQLLHLFQRADLFVTDEYQLLLVLSAYLSHFFPNFSLLAEGAKREKDTYTDSEWEEAKEVVEQLLRSIRFSLLSVGQLETLKRLPNIPQDLLFDAYAYKLFLMQNPLYDGSAPPYSEGFQQKRVSRRPRRNLSPLPPSLSQQPVVIGEIATFLQQSFVWRISDFRSLFPGHVSERKHRQEETFHSPIFIDEAQQRMYAYLSFIPC